MPTDRNSVTGWDRLFRVVFSLRALLVLVLVVGGTLGWIVREARVQRDAVATVQRLGGQYRYEWEAQNRRPTAVPLPGWRKWLINLLGPDYVGPVTQVDIGFGGSKVIPTADDLASIGRLARLERLSITSIAEGVGLAPLRNLTRLKELDFFGNHGRKIEIDVSALANFVELEKLQLSYGGMKDADLALIAGLTRLEHLSLSTSVARGPHPGPSITDAGLVALEPLHNLRFLQISGENDITNAGLVHLAGLTRLETLTLQGKGVTSLGSLRPLVGLTSLSVGVTDSRNPGVDDAGAAAIADLLSLKMVHLGSKSFTDIGLTHLHALPKLSYLNLSSSGVTDAGVAGLVAFPKLKYVFLGSTALTDAGLAALVKRPGLATIDVTWTKVTPEGIAAARAALPGTTILPRSNSTPGVGMTIEATVIQP